MLTAGKPTVLFLLPILLVGVFSWQQERACYCIRPDNGSNSTCGPCYSECYPLLHYVSDSAITQNDSYFCFLPGNYDLTEVWTLKSVHYLSLVAPKDDSSQHNASAFLTCSGSHSGLTIENVFGLTIMGLSFSNCGHIFKSDSIASSVLLMYVWDLHMSGVEIHHSHGWGMYCYSLLGNSNISHTKINGGHYITNYSGGNLRFKYRGVSDGTINVAISYSTFENGAENIADRNTYAGGVDIYLLTRNKINILFYKVEFFNNSGYDGGNVAISYTTLGTVV